MFLRRSLTPSHSYHPNLDVLLYFWDALEIAQSTLRITLCTLSSGPEMTREIPNSSFFKELSLELRQVWQWFRYRLASGGVGLRNKYRQLRRFQLDYIVLALSGPLPERASPPRGFLQRRLPFPPEPLSLETLNWQLERIADATNVKGVILILQDLPGGIAKLENLRRAIERLRSAGKECVIYTPHLDIRHYFVAAAANRIITPPSVTFNVLGLSAEAIFLKDALTKIGITVDVFQVSPYKGAFDTFGQADITPEQEEQLNWILDENFSTIIKAISPGRSLSEDEVRALIDSAPFPAQKALDVGLIDNLAYEDEIAGVLGDVFVENSPALNSTTKDSNSSEKSHHTKAKIATWSMAHSILLEKYRKPLNKHIGVISLEGQIDMGASRRAPIKLPIPIPLFGATSVGERTVLKLLRQAERDRRMAALVVLIDSGGGSPLASDLIWRQLQRISQKRPVLAYMGNVAASGGYYIAAAAEHIMGQPATITGSIGVVSLHVNMKGLYEKINVNRISLSRGQRATLYSDIRELTPEDHDILNQQLNNLYSDFKRIVANGRNIPYEDLDPICEGRVWTGRQAKDRGLIDSFGDLVDAIKTAAEMADLPVDDKHFIPVANLNQPSSGYVLPKAFEANEEIEQLIAAEVLRNYAGHPQFIMPFRLWFR